MFEEAKKEVRTSLDRLDFYSTNISWDYEFESDGSEILDSDKVPTFVLDEDLIDYIELKATKALYDLSWTEKEESNKIERFCIPIFTASASDYAVETVLKSYSSKGYMAQTYAKYLKTFIKDNTAISVELEKLIKDDSVIYEYQLMWIYAILIGATTINEKTINYAINHLRNLNYCEPLRSTCAIIIGKFGSAAQRRILKTHYSQEPSAFVKAAILYSARYFPKSERATCYNAWGGHNEINSLIVLAAKRIGDRR